MSPDRSDDWSPFGRATTRPRTVLPDGGEETETDRNENDDETSDESESDDETSDEESEEDEAKEAGGDVAEDESASHGTDRGTTVLYLDLEGLFLDLLGLEVDLHEVVLDVRAIPGSGKLLGNLLSAVAGLLGGGPLSTLLNRLADTVTDLVGRLVNGLTSPVSALGSLGSRITEAVTPPYDWLPEVGGLSSTVTAPLGWLRDGGGETDDAAESEENEEADGSESGGIRSRASNALPDGNRLTRATTSVLGELAGDDEGSSSPGTVGQRVGEILGRRLGGMITRALGGANDDEGSTQ